MNMQVLSAAASELESMRKIEMCSNNGGRTSLEHTPFPAACMNLLYSIPGNRQCVDCGAGNPQWASVTYGSLHCIECSGQHRHYGVNVSVIRSVTMDSWSHANVLAMLEGGNKQLDDFFGRHELSPSTNLSRQENSTIVTNRYRTNAAKFYKKNLALHSSNVSNKGMYCGRDAYRPTATTSSRCQQNQQRLVDQPEVQ